MATLDRYPPPLSPAEGEEIIQKAKDWALTNGVALRSKSSFSWDQVIIAPFTLFPSPFPQKEFLKALSLQTAVNELIHWVANKPDFLETTLARTLEGDEFTANLFKVYQEALKCPNRQTMSLGLLRTDYICSADSGIKQVETNTIASSFSALSCRVRSLHEYILSELGHENLIQYLPSNDAVSQVAEGLAEGCRHHTNPKGAILFVGEDVIINFCDQRILEFTLRKLVPERRVLKKSFKELRDQATLGPKSELFIGGEEVSLVYFRAGYVPTHYKGPQDWAVLLTLEKSMAIKCPSVGYHLAGTKKVQQVLSAPGALEPFITDPPTITRLRETFVGMFSLDPGEEGEAAAREAIASPFRFVLKPQREGGGNNLYDEEIPKALTQMSSHERGGWILMERIRPATTNNLIIRSGSIHASPFPVTSELGIYGIIIGDESRIVYNRVGGHVLRTKGLSTNEGGVLGGTGSLDSPLLT